MTTIFEEKAQKVYAEFEGMEQNFALLGQKKKQFETEAIAAREDEAKAKQAVSRALLNGDEAAAEAFRKTAKERAEFAEEREGAAKEAEAAITHCLKKTGIGGMAILTWSTPRLFAVVLRHTISRRACK